MVLGRWRRPAPLIRLEVDVPIPMRQEVSDRITFARQLADPGPEAVVVINTFSVDPQEVDAMLAVWAMDSQALKRQPGFISAQLHQGVGDSCIFVNYAVWESAAHLQAATQHPDFRRAVSETPPSVVTRPHLFRKIAVPGVCVA